MIQFSEATYAILQKCRNCEKFEWTARGAVDIKVSCRKGAQVNKYGQFRFFEDSFGTFQFSSLPPPPSV